MSFFFVFLYGFSAINIACGHTYAANGAAIIFQAKNIALQTRRQKHTDQICGQKQCAYIKNIRWKVKFNIIEIDPKDTE